MGYINGHFVGEVCPDTGEILLGDQHPAPSLENWEIPFTPEQKEEMEGMSEYERTEYIGNLIISTTDILFGGMTEEIKSRP